MKLLKINPQINIFPIYKNGKLIEILQIINIIEPDDLAGYVITYKKLFNKSKLKLFKQYHKKQENNIFHGIIGYTEHPRFYERFGWEVERRASFFSDIKLLLKNRKITTQII